MSLKSVFVTSELSRATRSEYHFMNTSRVFVTQVSAWSPHSHLTLFNGVPVQPNSQFDAPKGYPFSFIWEAPEHFSTKSEHRHTTSQMH